MKKLIVLVMLLGSAAQADKLEPCSASLRFEHRGSIPTEDFKVLLGKGVIIQNGKEVGTYTSRKGQKGKTIYTYKVVLQGQQVTQECVR